MCVCVCMLWYVDSRHCIVIYVHALDKKAGVVLLKIA